LRAEAGPLTQNSRSIGDVVLACHQMEEKIARLLSPQNKVTWSASGAPEGDLRKCVLDTYSFARRIAEQGWS